MHIEIVGGRFDGGTLQIPSGSTSALVDAFAINASELSSLLSEFPHGEDERLIFVREGHSDRFYQSA